LAIKTEFDVKISAEWVCGDKNETHLVDADILGEWNSRLYKRNPRRRVLRKQIS
jgi:hypothetical protein